MRPFVMLLTTFFISVFNLLADDLVIPPTNGGDGGGIGGKNGPNDFVPDGQPHVWFDSSASLFIVNISSLETTTLTVENASGNAVAQFSVITDGVNHTYPVASLPSGIYLVTLENVEETHSGYLLIP